jgi:hypothetical protein
MRDMNQPELKLTIALTVLEVYLEDRLKQPAKSELGRWCDSVFPEIDEISSRLTEQLLGTTNGKPKKKDEANSF